MKASTSDNHPVRRTVLTGVAAVLAALAVIVGYLTWRLHDYSRAKAAATVHVTGLVVADGIGGDGDIRVRWADASGAEHEQRLGVYDTDRYRRGARYPLRYDPAAPATAYPDDPDGDVHTDDLAFTVAVSAFVAGALLVPWPLRLLLWRRAARRPTAPMVADARLASYNLGRSTWLRLTPPHRPTEQYARYQRVMWQPEVEHVDGTAVLVHGDPDGRRRVVVELADGTRLWPVGMLRRREPRRWVLTERPDAGLFHPGRAAPGRGSGRADGDPSGPDLAGTWWRRAAVLAATGAVLGVVAAAVPVGSAAGVVPLAAAGAALALSVWTLGGAESRR
jgi:hypothetical protein